jgi:hypothetical protein
VHQAREEEAFVRRSTLLPAISIIVLSSLAATPAALAGSRSAQTIVGLPAWDRVASPNGPGGLAELRGVQAFSPTDVWAVGHSDDRTLTEHWTGTAFAVVPSPSVPRRGNRLEDVDGVAPNDVWAVGHADITQFLGSVSLALHWDGSTWTRVPTPNVGGSTVFNDLTGVAVVAPNDAWAVGTLESNDHGSRFRSLIQHWDGSKWSLVRTSCGSGLSKIDALSATDIWAVGGSDACHWNGSTWTHFIAEQAPNPEYFVNLIDVTMVSRNDAWAVGDEISECGESVCYSGDIHHWNGSSWEYVTNFLPIGFGVEAVAADDIWAVGPGPAILHYDGQAWSEVPAGVFIGELWGVGASGTADVWAAGEKIAQSNNTLIEHAPSATSGAVVGGSNVSGAVVSWFGSETGSVETDQFGDYQVGGLTAGRYIFTASYPGGCQPDSARITVQAGETLGHDFHLAC